MHLPMALTSRRILQQLRPRSVLSVPARAASVHGTVGVRARSSAPNRPEFNADLAAITAAAQEVNATFCCGGDMQPKSPIKLSCYDEKSVGKSEALLLSIPASETEIPDLLSLCQEASFGRGRESVLDPSYRSALSLSPTSFSTTFSLDQYGILGTIKTLMMPNTNGTLTAELYKLNVYRPGDFFKSHVDTPRGSGMFGSLVVCLPQPHKGGQLKLQKPPAREEQQGPPRRPPRPLRRLQLLQRRQQQLQQQLQQQQPEQQQQGGHEFDWGVNSSKGAVQWAAFYSDCPHEILPVESGYRITLTYNLFLAPASEGEPPLPGLSANSTALHAALKRALANPDFMPSGGTLGFACQHIYPHTQEGLCSSVPSMLKGGDAALLAAAHALGLKAEVKAVHDTKDLPNYLDWVYYSFDEDEDEEEGEDEDEDGEGVAAKDGKVKEDLGMRASAFKPPWFGDSGEPGGFGSREEVVSVLFGDSSSTAHVTWCRLPSRWALQQVNMTHANEPSISEWYSAAAIFVEVPERTLRS